ncbi:gem-associated protein 7 isoform X4 [Phocoena sinus]|uniref:Gem-associated protein 7 n=1 Tax=Phocoena sinus TaxID=42100 RepID=A0A8C9C5S9_PHOSS|nr:gem-associated protein 7 isoform X4 [Phocoena sinus]
MLAEKNCPAPRAGVMALTLVIRPAWICSLFLPITSLHPVNDLASSSFSFLFGKMGLVQGPFLQGADSRAAETGRASQEKGQSQSPLYARIMQTPLTTTVPVLRLPRGPDGLSRGFAPDGRRAPLKPVVPEIPESQESRESQEQRARATLRERYLRSLLAMVGRQVSFTLHEGVHVTAHFGATDLDVANFYVSQLQTPIGVQAEALLRCSDIVSYTFKP